MSSSIIIKKSSGPVGNLLLPGNRPQRPRVHGAFPAIQFGEQVLSTGIPSLDGYIAGGIPLGSVVVIKDEYPSRYADLVLKTFLAEGATYDHHLFVASARVEPKTFAEELPSLKKEKGAEKAMKEEESTITRQLDDMKIAWRYKEATPLPVTLSSRGQSVKGQKLAKFEFTKKATAQALGCSHLCLSKLDADDQLNPPSSQSLLREIASEAKEFELNSGSSSKPSNNLLRIGVSHCSAQVLDHGFLFGLRSIVQSTNSSAVITLSTLSDPKLLSKVENMADMVIQLEAILDDKKKDELGGVDGLCKIQKLNSLNSLKLFVPPIDLGFTYKHKRITFQELHLPPEGETTVQRESVHKGHPHSSSVASSSSCGTSKGVDIDF